MATRFVTIFIMTPNGELCFLRSVIKSYIVAPLREWTRLYRPSQLNGIISRHIVNGHNAQTKLPLLFSKNITVLFITNRSVGNHLCETDGSVFGHQSSCVVCIKLGLLPSMDIPTCRNFTKVRCLLSVWPCGRASPGRRGWREKELSDKSREDR